MGASVREVDGRGIRHDKGIGAQEGVRIVEVAVASHQQQERPRVVLPEVHLFQDALEPAQWIQKAVEGRLRGGNAAACLEGQQKLADRGDECLELYPVGNPALFEDQLHLVGRLDRRAQLDRPLLVLHS